MLLAAEDERAALTVEEACRSRELDPIDPDGYSRQQERSLVTATVDREPLASSHFEFPDLLSRFRMRLQLRHSRFPRHRYASASE